MSNKKKILVTGGAGFIGSFLVDQLVDRSHEVTIFDNLDPQVHPDNNPPEYLNKDARFVIGDIRDYDAFKSILEGQEVVFHLASSVGVGQSQYEIKKYIDVNTGGTANLLDILANHPHKIEKMIVAASMSSYGEGCYRNEAGDMVRPSLRTMEQMASGQWEPKCPNTGGTVIPIPTPEEAVQICNSIYAFSKKDQEDMVMNIGMTYDIPCSATRFFNVYGPRQSLSNPYTGVAAIFMSRIKNDHAPVIYEDGLQSRDFISVHDVARALRLCMENQGADYQIFNVGSGTPLSIKCIAETLAKLYGKDIEPEITLKFRKGDVRHCFADVSKIKEKISWEPQVSFEQGMGELIEWSREQEAVDKFEEARKELADRGIV